ncbi:restriction endonuclease subunit S [Paucilactobacillus nenjiangensis]|uniref:restriction endonuclease subunit S n=1 Tax=Paucilactobacillus nenjiangensis TaxID=1296540 RepID=UPI001CDCEB95|nr:restriction endonuclease subunit S [Paucilactobacillus nenjiangensis]
MTNFTHRTTVQNQYPVLTSSQKDGIVFQEDYFSNRQITTDNNIGYYILPKGYFTYRSRTDNGIFRFNRNDIVNNGIISYFYPVFKITSGDSDFFKILLNSTIDHEVDLAAEGTGQRVLSLKKFQKINVKIPNISEQEKIGKLFSRMECTIASNQRHQKKPQRFNPL